ncbi:MAG: hypothetical protein A2V53_02820 [Deltaproteobacteria bacterium RBG_19FT_COMBO_56_10]|nr:MAG: hypothetical protein A2V53_02820 [Deltaproteobacteria bacterium RBG_19FT_COMBO_56_10]
MDLRSCKTILVKGLQLGFALSLVAGIVPMKAIAEDVAADAAAVEAPAETGDAVIGKMYFTGEKRFESGAPACISCHSVSYGSLNGGVLGPNLTKVYADESKNPLLSAAWINGGSPVMAPIFGAKNVTDEEVSHLRAFFAEQSKGEVASSQTGTFTIIGLGGFVGILIVFNIIWSGRYRNRNKGTAHDALWRNYGGKGGR